MNGKWKYEEERERRKEEFMVRRYMNTAVEETNAVNMAVQEINTTVTLHQLSLCLGTRKS
jgi:hypothetical protein